MQRKIILLILFISLIFSNAIFAIKAHYSIIVDGGSHGTRLHLFKYSMENTLSITDILVVKNSKPLATFASHPEDAGPALKKLLTSAANKIHDDKIKEIVPIKVLGTGGMRILPEEQQQAIYNNIKYYIANKYKDIFFVEEAQSISGKMEGIYAWLDVNYQAKNFQNKKPTLGSLDMGGSSTQITFATDDTSKLDDELSITVNGIKYNIFSKSFLGLGLDRARNSINADFMANNCYPTGYPYSDTIVGFFNLANCAAIYNQLIENYHVSQQILPVYNVSTFIAFSGAYRTYHFFEIDKYLPAQINIEQKFITPICSLSWDKFKKSYPDESEEDLANYCADAIYITNLFYNTYKIQNTQLKIVSEINNNEINWALGALLYELVNNDHW